MSTVPDQPDGIDPDDPDDHTLPTLPDACRRVGEYLSWWGDGLIDTAETRTGETHPLYARDLQVLLNHADRPSSILEVRRPLTEDEARELVDRWHALNPSRPIEVVHLPEDES